MDHPLSNDELFKITSHNISLAYERVLTIEQEPNKVNQPIETIVHTLANALCAARELNNRAKGNRPKKIGD